MHECGCAATGAASTNCAKMPHNEYAGSKLRPAVQTVLPVKEKGTANNVPANRSAAHGARRQGEHVSARKRREACEAVAEMRQSPGLHQCRREWQGHRE